MRRICASDLEKREVINLCTGQKIGYICDYELDVDCGQILAIIVSSDSGIPFLSKKDEYAIPWCKIECIGEDTILIKHIKQMWQKEVICYHLCKENHLTN